MCGTVLRGILQAHLVAATTAGDLLSLCQMSQKPAIASASNRLAVGSVIYLGVQKAGHFSCAKEYTTHIEITPLNNICALSLYCFQQKVLLDMASVRHQMFQCLWIPRCKDTHGSVHASIVALSPDHGCSAFSLCILPVKQKIAFSCLLLSQNI